jgi:uncharacterized cupin superfamily protein
MQKYPVNNSFDSLEPWPFEGEVSNYEILRGNPKASGRFDLGGGDGRHRLGIWSCTEGTFRCTEQGDELQTILRGHLTLTNADGDSIDAGPGDSIFTRKGERVTWDIHEEVTKVFFTHNSEGIPAG